MWMNGAWNGQPRTSRHGCLIILGSTKIGRAPFKAPSGFFSYMPVWNAPWKKKCDRHACVPWFLRSTFMKLRRPGDISSAQISSVCLVLSFVVAAAATRTAAVCGLESISAPISFVLAFLSDSLNCDIETKLLADLLHHNYPGNFFHGEFVYQTEKLIPYYCFCWQNMTFPYHSTTIPHNRSSTLSSCLLNLYYKGLGKPESAFFFSISPWIRLVRSRRTSAMKPSTKAPVWIKTRINSNSRWHLSRVTSTSRPKRWRENENQIVRLVQTWKGCISCVGFEEPWTFAPLPGSSTMTTSLVCRYSVNGYTSVHELDPGLLAADRLRNLQKRSTWLTDCKVYCGSNVCLLGLTHLTRDSLSFATTCDGAFGVTNTFLWGNHCSSGLLARSCDSRKDKRICWSGVADVAKGGIRMEFTTAINDLCCVRFQKTTVCLFFSTQMNLHATNMSVLASKQSNYKKLKVFSSSHVYIRTDSASQDVEVWLSLKLREASTPNHLGKKCGVRWVLTSGFTAKRYRGVWIRTFQPKYCIKTWRAVQWLGCFLRRFHRICVHDTALWYSCTCESSPLCENFLKLI